MPALLHRARTFGAAAVALGLGLATLIAPASASAAASDDEVQLLRETFTGDQLRDPAFLRLDDACLTKSAAPAATGVDPSIAGCAKTAGTPTPATAGGGWLQLTDVTGSARGGVLYDRPVPASAGIVVTFEQAQFGGNGADGIGFFLTDGTSALTIAGGYGGSLGYAQRNAEPGVAGGYVGVGLDAYGNYWNDGEGRGAGCAVRNVTGTLHKDTVSVRGPGNGTTSYCLLASQTLTSGHSLRATTLDAAPRTVRLTVAPQDAAATHGPDITVQIDWNGDGDFDDTDETVVSGVHAAALAPAMYKFGFTASTGGSNDAHLIRNLVVTTAAPLVDKLTLTKQASSALAVPTFGEPVTYTYVVTNTSSTPVRSVVIDDLGLDAPATCAPAGDLAVGAQTTCTGTHTVTAAEVLVPSSNGSSSTTIDTDAWASASAVGTGMLVPSNRADAPVTVASRPDVEVEPLSGPGGVVVRDAGGAVTDLATTTVQAGWSATPVYVVTNTGNTRVDLTVTSGASALTCAATAIDPGGSTECTGLSAPITAADIVAGTLTLPTATALGTDLTGAQSPQRSASAVLPLLAVPLLDLTGVSSLTDVDGDGVGDLGEVVTYTYTVTNRGNVDLSDVTVDGVGGVATCTPGTLAPGASGTCVLARPVTEGDVLAGSVDRTAVAHGTPASGGATSSGPVAASTPAAAPVALLGVTATPHLIDGDGDGRADAGEGVTVSYVVTNLGNVTIDDVVVDSSDGPVVCAVTTLAPGASTTCAGGAHVVTSAEAALGVAVARATASGRTAAGPVAQTASTVVPTVVDPVDPPVVDAVQPVAAPLATTGADTAAALQLAALLVGTGLVLVGAATFRGRRRRAYAAGLR